MRFLPLAPFAAESCAWRWQYSETAILHSGLPFSVLSAPYRRKTTAFSVERPAICESHFGCWALSQHRKGGCYANGLRQWLNPDAFVSVVDPSTGACFCGDSPVNCQFGNSGRNQYRGPHFTYSEVYVTKKVAVREGVTFRLDTQFFNVFTIQTLRCRTTIRPAFRESPIPNGIRGN